jgi:hypothetical protein
MDWWKLNNLIWKAIMSVIVAAMVFTAPVSHATTHPCPTQQGAVMENGGNSHHEDGQHHSKNKAAFNGEICCNSTCALCTVAAHNGAVRPIGLISIGRIDDLPKYLAGFNPSPGLEPPRPFA